MVLCKACGRDLTGAKGSCPRCGFRPPAVIGDPEAAQALIAKRAVKHMKEFMQRLDVGVTVYLWKEQEDAVVSNGQQRLSFGTGDSLQEAPRFLERKFSRVPDLAEMEVEISLLKDGDVLTEQTVSLPVPPGSHLLELGAQLTSSLELKLILKNPQGQTQSVPLVLE